MFFLESVCKPIFVLMSTKISEPVHARASDSDRIATFQKEHASPPGVTSQQNIKNSPLEQSLHSSSSTPQDSSANDTA